MFLQEGSSCVWGRPGPSLPSRHSKKGQGVMGRGWTASSLGASCSQSLSLLCPSHRPSLLTAFCLLALQTLLPTSLSCLVLEFSMSLPTF